jgi:hypothetical protein
MQSLCLHAAVEHAKGIHVHTNAAGKRESIQRGDALVGQALAPGQRLVDTAVALPLRYQEHGARAKG